METIYYIIIGIIVVAAAAGIYFAVGTDNSDDIPSLPDDATSAQALEIFSRDTDFEVPPTLPGD